MGQRIAKGLSDAAQAFASSYWVAAILVACTFIPAWFLPRNHEESHLLDDSQAATPVVLH